MSTRQLLDDAAWSMVPAEALRLAKLAAAYVLPADDGSYNVWYDGDHKVAYRQTPGADGPVDVLPERPWLLVKRAGGEPLAPVAQLAGWKKGLWPTSPNAVTATLGSGLLGAGVGYGAGWLAEQMLPAQYVERGRLRRVGAGLGAAAGVVPPIWAAGRGWFDKEAREALQASLDPEELALHPWYERYAESVKRAWDEGVTGTGGTAGMPMIPVDAFNQAIWADPYTPPAYQAAASGIVTSARQAAGGSPWISPLDIARVGLGMGVGAAEGMVAGKLLGALAGLKPDAQQTLQRVGMWGGLIQTAVPLLFGGR